MDTFTFPIQTRRLLLRPLQMTDLDDLFTYYSNELVTRFLYIDAQNKEELKEALQAKIKQTSLQEKDDKLSLAVVLLNENRVIGEVRLFLKKPEHNTAEIGYVFNPDYKGQGYATEAGGMMLKIGFEHFKFHRIFARCDARNASSYKLMERLGMHREAHLVQNEFVKGEWTDELEYAILQEEWRKNKAS